MELMSLLKALISRLMFIGHGVYAVYLHYMNTGNMYDWFLVTPAALIVIEAAVTLVYRKGVEYKYLWPSGFLYISCLVPVIWLIELDLMNVRIRDHTDTYPLIHQNITDLNIISDSQSQQLRGGLLMKALLGSKELRKKVCELGLIIGVIIGRWMIPRGSLTRDQLSTLLLGYVGNSADILEIFTTFEEHEVFDKRQVAYAIMIVFTLSVYQFALVTTATMDSVEEENITGKGGVRNRVHPCSLTTMERLKQRTPTRNEYNIGQVRTRKYSLQHTNVRDHRAKGRKISVPLRKISQNSSTSSILSQGRITSPTGKHTLPPIRQKREKVDIGSIKEKDKSTEQASIHGEVFQILVTLLMQDGPFLILRAYLIIKYSVASEMHIFFTCKNAIVSVLLVYRLLILSRSGNEKETEWHREEAETKLRNIQQEIENIKLKDVESGKMYVQ